jgi:hypothetical protein
MLEQDYSILVCMSTYQTPEQTPTERPPEDADDLGSQLEELLVHVLRCERWARIDDRIALSLAVEQATRRRRQR